MRNPFLLSVFLKFYGSVSQEYGNLAAKKKEHFREVVILSKAIAQHTPG